MRPDAHYREDKEHKYMKQQNYENKGFIRKPIALVYTGEGITIAGIPARDLTAEEVEQYGGMDKLLQTGIFATPDEIRFDGGVLCQQQELRV
jgi:hypothetical protein